MKQILILLFIGFLALGYYFLPTLAGIFHFHCYDLKFCSGEDVVEINKTLNFQDADVITVSDSGSTRATAYPYLTKIIQLNKGFAISWLDVIDNDFRLKVRVFDEHNISKIEYDLGSVVDNHGGASLAVTEDNRIHVVYYPHSTSHALYRNALVSNSIKWSKPIRIGDHLTYPNIVSYKDKIAVVARRNKHRIGRDKNVELVLYNKLDSQTFGKAEIIFEAKLEGYAGFDAEIVLEDVNDKLYLALKRHEGSNQGSYGWLQSIELNKFNQVEDLESFVTQWKEKSYKTLNQLNGGVSKNNSLSLGSLGLTEKIAALPVVVQKLKTSSFYLWIEKRNETHVVNISSELERKYPKFGFTGPVGGAAIDENSNIFVVTTVSPKPIQRQRNDIQSWGSKGSRLFFAMIDSSDLSTVCSFLVNDILPEYANWLPHIREIHGNVMLMFTSGMPGVDSSDTVSGKVYLKNLSRYSESQCNA